MIPLRFIGEHFGAEVAWDEATRTVALDLPENVDEEALGLLIKAFEKQKDVKKAKVDFKAVVSTEMSLAGEKQDIQFNMEGTYRIKRIKNCQVPGRSSGSTANRGTYR